MRLFSSVLLFKHLLFSTSYGSFRYVYAIILSLNQFTQDLNPYAKVLENVGTPPYLPLTILSFYPAIVMKCDPRIIALLYLAITFALIIFKFKHLNKLSKITICLILINPYWLMRHDLYFQLFLLEITVIILYFENLTEAIRIIILGLFITTLQFAWILYPFILLAFSKNAAQLIRQAVASLLIAGLITLFYTQNYVLTFYHAIFLHKEYLSAYNSDITFGLSTIFHFAKSQVVLYMLQIIGCGLLLLYCAYQYFIKQIRNTSLYLSCAVVSYFYFIITNYFIETYLFIPVLLAIALCNNKETPTPLATT